MLNAMLIENPPGFSIHEAATISGVWPVVPCYSISCSSIRSSRRRPPTPSSASWPRSGRGRTTTATWSSSCAQDVKWHDGQPFTAQDVKYTFDVVREAPDAAGKLRLNPRKDWYANVEAIETPDAYTVVFRLKRPQPSLLLMLASGYSPVYAAHVPLNELRTALRGHRPLQAQGVRAAASSSSM